MRTILNMADPLLGLLAPQHFVEGGEPYRLMRYVVRQPVEEGLLLYNVMTKAMVLLDPDEVKKFEKDPSAVPGLVEGWFVVPESHDDRKLAREVRAVGKMLSKPAKGISGYTILTTTDCNARCFYCYEKGRSRIHMTEETADAIIRYIIKHSSGENVRLRWFGGEPLFNKRVITRICTRLKEAGVPFRSSMVSNGLLFDEPTIAEAVDLWKLKKIQITLDGTEVVYNRVKNYVNPEGSPFRRVLGNIRLLVNAGVRVNIRLNIDRHNADDLFILADLLGAEFGGNPLVRVYSHSLFEACDVRAAVNHDDIQRRELFEKQKRLREKLRDAGLSSPGKLAHSLKLNRCMADNDSSIVILPDGHVGKCEHFSDSEWFSHVLSEEIDDRQIASFKQVRPELEACSECVLYPDCFRLSKCEEAVHCYPEEREDKLLTLRDQILSYYKGYAVSD